MTRSQILQKLRVLRDELAILEDQIPQDLGKIIDKTEEIKKYEAMLNDRSRGGMER